MSFRKAFWGAGALAFCLVATPALAGGNPDYRQYQQVPSYKGAYTAPVQRQYVYQQPQTYTTYAGSYPAPHQYAPVYRSCCGTVSYYTYSYPVYGRACCKRSRRRCR